jgi:hypothetical protein
MSDLLRRFAILLGLVALAPLAAQDVKLVIAPVVQQDPSPREELALGELGPQLLAKARAAFPGQVLDLSGNAMLQPEDRVVVIVPVLSAVRLSREVAAGSILRMDATVVGSLSAWDPWTDANLFSATRMVSGQVEVGESKLAEAPALTRKAFQAAADRWMDACMAQLKAQLSPFVLSAALLTPPKRIAGGYWPFGSLRGVKKGALLSGAKGQRLEVVDVFPKYAFVRDAVEPSQPLTPGERFSLTVASAPKDRPEPRVALVWRGTEPQSPSGLRGLGSDAYLALVSHYISQAATHQVLPVPFHRPEARAQFKSISEEISRHSALAKANLITVQRETLVQVASEAPERRVEIGALEAYHGLRRREDGVKEHYFRLQMAAVVESLSGTENHPLYPMVQLVRHTEEFAIAEQVGVRVVDLNSAWFTTCRNAAIQLSRKVVAALDALPRGPRRMVEGRVGTDGRVTWAGPAPTAYVPLAWVRPLGDLRDGAGAVLGTAFERLEPAQGYLNASILAQEKMRSGDVLRFEERQGERPLATMRPPQWEPGPLPLPEASWIQALVAGELLPHAPVAFVLTGAAEQDAPSIPRAAQLLGSGFQLHPGNPSQLSGQWRLRLFATAAAEPLAKTGLQTDRTVTLGAAPLDPPDRGGWCMAFLADSLSQLARAARDKGLMTHLLPPLSKEVP